jgi:hypothetical protein
MLQLLKHRLSFVYLHGDTFKQPPFFEKNISKPQLSLFGDGIHSHTRDPILDVTGNL